MDIKFNDLVKCTAVFMYLSTVALISGCSDENSTTPELKKESVETKAESKQQAPEEPTPADQGVTILDAPGSNPQSDEFYKITRGMDLLYIFNANAPGTKDVLKEVDKITALPPSDLGDKALSELYDKYQSSDQFDKRDIAKKIEPILIDNIEKISTIKHFSVDVQGAIGLGDYDFDKQGYVVTNSLADENGIESLTPYKRTSIAYNDSIKYKLSFIGTTKFNFVPMLDESAARVVNEYTKLNDVSFRIYGYVHSVAEENNNSYNIRHVVIKAQKIEMASSIYNEGPRQVFASIEL